MLPKGVNNFMTTEMMKCQRCKGLLVRDSIYNLDGQFYHLEVLRCLNCGETVDTTILKARGMKNEQSNKKELQFSSGHVN
ncbi:LIM domain-containing protein [Candidatus Nitrospira allomarina]|uniref:LIM domain-containing protein n=1 Tax=Candidatus Nitrospira allomarina TaxID=3020900 RepID=UPI0035E3E2D1